MKCHMTLLRAETSAMQSRLGASEMWRGAVVAAPSTQWMGRFAAAEHRRHHGVENVWDGRKHQGFGPACVLPGVGHDIGRFEASILNEFLRQHASDAYFEVEGLDWDEFEIEIDVGPPIPGINA